MVNEKLDSKKYAGHFSEICLEMVRVGSKQARNIVTGPWHDPV